MLLQDEQYVVKWLSQYGETNPQKHTLTKNTVSSALASAASCTKNASYYYSCSDCGYVQNGTGAETFEAVNTAFGHSIVIDSAISASCTNTGLTEGSHCRRCHEILTAQKTIPALLHHYVNHVCSRCGAKEATTPPTDNTKPTVPTTPTNPITTPTAGTVLTNETTNELYVVTGTNTVDYKKPNTYSTIVNIPSDIILNGITYQVTGIASNAFYMCTKLKQVTIGKNITVIGDRAFYKCTALSKIKIPSNIKKIGKLAFYKNNRLKNITILTKKLTKKSVGKQAFLGIHVKAKIKVPSKKRTAYKKLLKAKGVKGKNQKIV